LRVHLISAELAAAGALLAAVVLVAPSELSKVYALITIISGVLPGLLLTGDIKLLNAGVGKTASNLRFKFFAAAVTNIPVCFGFLLTERYAHPLPLLLGFVALGTLGGTAQAFTSVWYYVQADKRRMLGSKRASAAVKLTGAVLSIYFSEFSLALIGMTLGTMLEFGLNFRSLPWTRVPRRGQRREIISPLGAAYGVSRIVSASIRLGLEELFGVLIASFLIIEQLVGGLNSTFEKYFVRAVQWRRSVRALKAAYLLTMAVAAPLLLEAPLLPGDRSALLWLAMVACAGLLPLSEMYSALQRRGQTFVALGSVFVTLIIAVFMATSWYLGHLRSAALAAYILLPGATFILYWLSSLDARHNAEH
jgi:hypothetical protein